MTTKNEARHIGEDIGWEIVGSIFKDAFWQWSKDHEYHEGIMPEEDIQRFRDYVEELAVESEENARQFSPFEVTANEFNASKDPEGVWRAYERGVFKGIRESARDMIKTNLDKQVVYFPANDLVT